MRRGPIKPRRATPRRDEGRVKQVRIKPRAKAAPTAEEQRHIERVAGIGCLVCGRGAEVHHLMTAPGKVRRRDHRFIAPLCPDHHRTGWGAVHALGSEAAFLAEHGVDIVAWGVAAWEDRER